MPMVNYICPDGVSIKIEDCLGKCRLDGRCVTLPTLQLMSRRRPWKGKLSTTQALNGVRYIYLTLTKDYGEKPVDRAFALLGTFHHLRMQNVSIPESLTEEWLGDELGTGMFDFYDPTTRTMYDYKTCGGYKINRVLGKKKVTVDEPTGEVYKTGKRAGEPKTRKASTWHLGTPDDFDWRMQLSRYAVLLEDAGFKVDEIVVQATVRDYNAMTARMYALDRQIYLISMEKFPKDIVIEFYRRRHLDIAHALESNSMPPPCNARERWLDEDAEDPEAPGRRCQSFCPVWEYCDLGIKGHEQVQEEGEV
jgi:hypothetical protein